MKFQEIVFARPAFVVQVFRMINTYGKDEKSFADREQKLQWPEIRSTSGYVDSGKLYLPDSITGNSLFGNCQLITIEDQADAVPQPEWKLICGKYEKGNNHCFNLHHDSQYELFSFRGVPPELSLHYDSSYHGDPSRDRFHLGTLDNGAVLEIKIDGKIDTPARRYYKEQDFVFQQLGVFDRCFLADEKMLEISKSVPENRRLINLLKPLW